MDYNISPVIKNKQDGAVLFTGLMFLLVLTVLGISAVRNSTLESKIANNYNQLNITFQAADAAIANMSTIDIVSETLQSASTVQVSALKTSCLDPDNDCSDFPVESIGRSRYLGQSSAMGNSLGTFTSYHFNFTGEGSIPDPTNATTKADKDKDISRTLLSKGGYILAPKM
ncbi:MAG: PilX N-terminal domain-containing pilus assembly protein [Pseudomonadota bacterium]